MDEERYISYIESFLIPKEKVELIVKQTRWWPAVPFNSIFKPIITFITNERVLILSRHDLGLKRNVTIIPLAHVRAIRLQKGLILCSVVIGYMAEIMEEKPGSLDGLTYSSAKAFVEHMSIKLSEEAESVRSRRKPIFKEEEGKKCETCGEINDPAYDYCYHCGARLYSH
ncbi:MAG: hypothetical protein KGH61_02810 [Candidatus Micrarchaeota archaeon]|nr:hypothetical protein [Candidatus Micrarchaeota archaeon]MDE1847855.1 hypothetical protein [Candidatus Micrarchaeota archaeon]MDE1864182.1 hypothetical protein [Candidatus Micrarchaeota archaeon]